jgi:hypothetical protein
MTHAAKRTEQTEQLFAFSAVGEEQGNIVRVNGPEVAVKGVGGVKPVGPGASRVERSRDFPANFRGFAHARNANPAAGMEEEVDRRLESIVEAVRYDPDRLGFGAENFPGEGESVESGTGVGGGGVHRWDGSPGREKSQPEPVAYHRRPYQTPIAGRT